MKSKKILQKNGQHIEMITLNKIKILYMEQDRDH